MVFEDVCNTGLGLALGCQAKLESPLKSEQQRQKKPSLNFDNLLFLPSTSAATTALKLGLSNETYQASRKIDVNQGYLESPDVVHSAVSSFSNASVKRERDAGSEEIEVEKLSSRASDEDEEGSSARKKLRLTKEQSALLEDRFREHSTLNPKQKQALAKQLNLRPRQVEVWFQNRRARTKLKQTEVDCEILKKCCQTLTDENRRLQKELQELKALKLSSPLYMQLPAATLTMCPSCERIGGAGVDGSSNSKVPYSMAAKPHFYNPFTHPSAAC